MTAFAGTWVEPVVSSVVVCVGYQNPGLITEFGICVAVDDNGVVQNNDTFSVVDVVEVSRRTRHGLVSATVNVIVVPAFPVSLACAASLMNNVADVALPV